MSATRSFQEQASVCASPLAKLVGHLLVCLFFLSCPRIPEIPLMLNVLARATVRLVLEEQSSASTQDQSLNAGEFVH